MWQQTIVPPMYDDPDMPCECLACTRYRRHPCVGKRRAENHMQKVNALLARSDDTITVTVGPEEESFTLPKLPASYFSSYLDSLIFPGLYSKPGPKARGGGSGVGTGTSTGTSSVAPHSSSNTAPPSVTTVTTRINNIDLPFTNASEFRLFATWLSTGCIPWVRLSQPPFPDLENLWVLSHYTLRSPSFSNSIMHLLIADYDAWSLNADIAQYSFENTMRGDSLRRFLADLIASNGPFSEKSGLTRQEKDRWVEILAKGGELVRECVEAGFNCEGDVEPMMVGEWWRYLVREEKEGELLLEDKNEEDADEESASSSESGSGSGSGSSRRSAGTGNINLKGVMEWRRDRVEGLVVSKPGPKPKPKPKGNPNVKARIDARGKGKRDQAREIKEMTQEKKVSRAEKQKEETESTETAKEDKEEKKAVPTPSTRVLRSGKRA